MWRGDSSPLGCEAAPNRTLRCIRYPASNGFATASQPNGAVRRFAKSPHQKGSLLQGICVSA
jgi:hypothetical protein